MSGDPTPLGESLPAAAQAAQEAVARARAAAEQAGRVVPDAAAVPEDPARARRRATFAALVPTVYGDPRLGQLDDVVQVPLRAWVRGTIEGGRTNLLITGPVGTGKSHAGYAVLRPLVGADVPVAAYTVGALLDVLRPSDDVDVEARGRDARRRLSRAGVVLLDDVGAEKASEWTVERLALIVHERWEAGLPSIITSNLQPADLRVWLGERCYSRFTDDAVHVRMGGADRRATP